MSLPETIWWCERHGHGFYVVAGADPPPDHPGVEVELHPVGSRVAGPDDLLIRREADGKWPERAISAIEYAFEPGDEVGGFLEQLLDALAAAEGGET